MMGRPALIPKKSMAALRGLVTANAKVSAKVGLAAAGLSLIPTGLPCGYGAYKAGMRLD
jgi:hypothetical protein